MQTFSSDDGWRPKGTAGWVGYGKRALFLNPFKGTLTSDAQGGSILQGRFYPHPMGIALCVIFALVGGAVLVLMPKTVETVAIAVIATAMFLNIFIPAFCHPERSDLARAVLATLEREFQIVEE